MPAAALVEEAIALLRSALADAPPELVSGTDAATMVGLCSQAERVAAAASSRYARRVEVTGAYQASGHRSGATWLAEVRGESVGQALGVLETQSQLAEVPAVLDAFVDGQLSLAQAKTIASSRATDRQTLTELLDAARRESFRDLQAKAARATRRASAEEAEVAKEARAHAGRYLRTSQPAAGGLRLEAWLTKAEGARLLAGLEATTSALFDQARRSGRREPLERYRADALVRLGAGGGAPSSGTLPRVLVRVDAAALRRGSVESDETCEIAGVGTVPLARARALLDDALVNVVVRRGIDIACVTSTTRTVPQALRLALVERDPVCVVPGCTASSHLEIHHYRLGHRHQGPTSLANLARVCKPHHDLMSYRGWQLDGEPGNWTWIGPGSGQPSNREPIEAVALSDSG
jgi:hypothetical protein